METLKKVIGYQTINKEQDIHPDMEGSWVVYCRQEALDMADNIEWKIIPIYEGDIEGITYTFSGPPDNPTETGLWICTEEE